MAAQALLPLAQQAGTWLWNNPYAREIALRTGVGLGSAIGGKLLGGDETERYQKQLQEQMRLIQEQIRSPGRTPVGQAIQRTIKQQGKQAQQSLAASAAQKGQTGTSPARARQMQQMGRETEQQSMAMAQLSTAAQADYTNLLASQERLAAEERSKIGGIMNFIAQGVADVATRKLLMETLQGATAGGTTTPTTEILVPSVGTNLLPQGPGERLSTTPEAFMGGDPTSTIPQPAQVYGPPAPALTPSAPTAGTTIPDYTIGGMYNQQQQDQLSGLQGLRSGTTTTQQGWRPEMTPSAERRQLGPAQTAEELRAGVPQMLPPTTTLPQLNRPEDVRYPSSLIQRAPMTEQQPGYTPPTAAPLQGAGVQAQPTVSPTGITAEQIPEEQAGTQPPVEFSIVSEIQRQYYEGEISVEQYQTMLNEIQVKYTLTPEDIRIMVDWGKDLYWQQRGRMNRSGYGYGGE